MKTKKHYADRDVRKQGKYFTDHMLALTAEDLNGKAEIASELAHRDMQIDNLQARVEWLMREILQLTRH